MTGYIQLLYKHTVQLQRGFTNSKQYEKVCEEAKSQARTLFEAGAQWDIVAIIEDSLVNVGDLRSLRDRRYRKTRTALRKK